MTIVSLSAAQQTLPDLVDAAARGEEVIIERDGLPRVRLVAETDGDKASETERTFSRGYGAWKGRYQFPAWDEWKALDAEIEADFENVINKPDP